MPGDHIKLVNKQVFINGKPLNEPYVDPSGQLLCTIATTFPRASPNMLHDPKMAARASQMLRDDVVNGELVVPPGNYFAMGDNRDNSLDSRYWGLVPRDNIIGKPLIIFWSYDAPTEDLKDYNLHHIVRSGDCTSSPRPAGTEP